jgi:GNAT superfamily N-acetyltransferase
MIQYRKATKEDLELIHDFHCRVGKKERSFADFKWEFTEGPSGTSIYVIGLDGSRIVGTNCVIPIEIVDSNSLTLMTGKSEDTLVDPAYRGQNIFKDLYDVLFDECRKAGIHAVWGFTPAIKPFLKIGFQVPFNHTQSLLVFKVFSSFQYLSSKNPDNSLLSYAKIFALSALSRVKYSFARKSTGGISVKKVDTNKHFLNLCSTQITGIPDAFIIHQNNDYYTWRFRKNPHLKNIQNLDFADAGGRTIASAVVNITSFNICYISHLVWLPDLSIEIKKRVVFAMSKYIKRQGVSAIRNWHFRTNEYNREEIRLFENCSYMMIDRGIAFVWKNLSGRPIDPNNFVLSRASTQGLF